MQLVYASAALRLLLNREQDLLYLDWQPGVTSDGFRWALTVAVAMTRVQGLRRWVTYNPPVYPLPPAEQLWLQEHAMLALTHSSLQLVAIVVPAYAFHATAPESLINTSRPLVSYDIQYFSTFTEAYELVQAGPAYRH